MQYLLILLILFSVSCAVGYGWAYTRRPSSTIRSTVKTCSTAALAAVSLLAAGPALLTAGLALGAAGDLFLSLEREKGFLPGLAAFLAGHLCFVFLFFQFGLGYEILLAEIWRAMTGFAVFFFAAVMAGFLWPYLAAMKIPVTAYILAIAAMGIGALTQPLHWAQWLVLPGALAFMASDTILSLELFVMDENHPARAVTAPILWCLYWSAQALFAGAFLF